MEVPSYCLYTLAFVQYPHKATTVKTAQRWRPHSNVNASARLEGTRGEGRGRGRAAWGRGGERRRGRVPQIKLGA